MHSIQPENHGQSLQKEHVHSQNTTINEFKFSLFLSDRAAFHKEIFVSSQRVNDIQNENYLLHINILNVVEITLFK